MLLFYNLILFTFLVNCYLPDKQKIILTNIQNDLFDLGADLATPIDMKKKNHKNT